MRTLVISLCLFSNILFSQQTVENKIKVLYKTELEKEKIKSGILHVYSETRDIDIQIAESKIDSISINSPFYTASVTKMLTAVAIGILKDQNKLNFEDKIAKYLPDALMKNLHVLDEKSYSNHITIVHLLQHTSGLPDYFSDQTNDESPNIINQILTNPNKTWTGKEMIQYSKDKMTPHFIPGKGYHYTDTEYVLLALIIENVSGLSLDNFFLQYMFQPLGMNGSYMNLKSKPLKKQLPMAEFYVEDIALSSFQSLSADWGGGGLVSTTQDLITFFKAFNGNVLVKKNTRLAMQSWVHETKGMKYGFGIRLVSLGELTDTDTTLQLIGHSGSTASFLWYCPQLDTYIAGSLNQLEASKSAMILVYDLLKRIENK